MESHAMFFDGTLLERGFWLYIWDIQRHPERYLYIGRTGDSSSPNAASPFARIGQHLDFRPNAKANSIARLLKEKNLVPSSAKFEMLAIGPLFPEQESFKDHIAYRDKMAALENALAEHIRSNGYNVLGTHNSRKAVDKNILREVVEIVEKHFPPRGSQTKKKLSLIPIASLKKAGIASLENAKTLFDEAKILHDKTLFARALCLSIIGQEELGKAVLFALAGLDLFPDIRKRLSNRDLSNPAFEHDLKQLLEEYWGIAVWQLDEYHQIMMDEIGWEYWSPISDVEWLEDLFVSIMEEDSSFADIIRKKGKAKKMMKKRIARIPDESTTEEKKHRGFYVDLKPDGLFSEPKCIDEVDSRLAIGELESAIADFERLERVFKNSEDWNSLEARLKKRMT
jgi:AbiV family abortive infection protein